MVTCTVVGLAREEVKCFCLLHSYEHDNITVHRAKSALHVYMLTGLHILITRLIHPYALCTMYGFSAVCTMKACTKCESAVCAMKSVDGPNPYFAQNT